ncbi:MAG: HD domain-containing protein [Candidatus Anstonellaceae archaeon]
MAENKIITIRDPIHGQIDLFDYEVKLLDLPIFQRLRNIKQVGLTYLVYPGAQHSRFEHSIGSLFLAEKFAAVLKLDQEKRRYLRLSALLHDLGHMAFSHDSEMVVKKQLNLDHEVLTKEFIKNSPIREVLQENSLDEKKLINFLDGNDVGAIVSFDVGADRLDYLLRDSYYTGVAYGIIEWERVVSSSKWKKDRPIISAGGIEAAESTILARFLMFHTVYYQHTVRIARAMFQRALQTSIKEKVVDLEKLKVFGDLELLYYLKDSSNELCSYLANCLLERRLYKRALVLEWEKLSKQKKDFIKNKLEEMLYREFLDDAILIMPENFSSSINLEVEDKNGKIQKLQNISPLTSSLLVSAAKKATLIICSKKELVSQIKRKVKSWLNL